MGSFLHLPAPCLPTRLMRSCQRNPSHQPSSLSTPQNMSHYDFGSFVQKIKIQAICAPPQTPSMSPLVVNSRSERLWKAKIKVDRLVRCCKTRCSRNMAVRILGYRYGRLVDISAAARKTGPPSGNRRVGKTETRRRLSVREPPYRRKRAEVSDRKASQGYDRGPRHA